MVEQSVAVAGRLVKPQARERRPLGVFNYGQVCRPEGGNTDREAEVIWLECWARRRPSPAKMVALFLPACRRRPLQLL
jgi:hypothetical protein